MSVKEWALPAAITVLAFGGFWVLQPHLDLGAGADTLYADTGGYAYAFDSPPRVPDHDHPATVILLSREAQDAPDGSIWRSPHVALQGSLPFNVLCLSAWPCGWTHELADASEPRLGVAGHNATRVTVHVFDESGALVASNAPEAERARFPGGARAEDLPSGLWYLGANGTAPPGTQRPPAAAGALLDRLLPQMQGLPVGGVASIETNQLRWLYGTLYVTVRIEALALAP